MWLTFIITYAALYLLYRWLCRLYIPVNHQVPTLPGYLPSFGHFFTFLNIKALYDNFLRFGKITNELGGVSKFFYGPYPFYFVTHPEDIALVQQKCLQRHFLYKFVEPVLGKMLVAAEVPVWKHNRRIVDLSFKQKVLDGYIDVFNKEAEGLSKAFTEYVGNGNVDVTQTVTTSVLETTCKTTLGTVGDDENLVNDKYKTAVDSMMKIIYSRFLKPWCWFEPIFNLTADKKKLDENMPIFFGLSEKMIKLRKAERLQRLMNEQKVESPKFQSFLDILLETMETDTGSTYKDDELRNLVDNVLIAAFDTTINALIIILVCLGSRPDVQEKIFKEIMAVLGDDKKVTKENLSKLVYLEASVKEVLRLYPIGPFVGRLTTSDTELRKFTLPSGSIILIHLWAANRHPEFWGDDAEEFRPERWLSDTLTNHPAAFASFAPGRRGCPGKTYALMYLKTTLAHLIRRYKFKADVTKMKVEYHVMIKPKSEHEITVEYRK